ncbi:hypothetical protein F4604DRAFT_1885698 [Suillus subluteus]|nr:hypothetical protein F4604DRAFT_1885698 [Suillus subluteus]
MCVCGEEAAIYRCQDCHSTELFCHLCMVHVHERQPFHKMEHWDGISFHGITSKSMGICLQFGHTSGVCCDNPLLVFNDDFVIINYNGIYEVGLDFCGCASAQPHITQLLRVCLFPATTVDPKTATTFWSLEYFQMLSFKSKVSAYEFYKTAAHLTDNTGIHVPKDHYESMLRMMREWWFIKQMQRTGQGHHPKGIAATEQGACAVLCPAYPHAGKNLPDGWENVPSEIWYVQLTYFHLTSLSHRSRFIYALFLAIDANFRLARRNISSDTVDPGLNHGYAFFVEEKAYKCFIRGKYIILFILGTKDNSMQMSSCSSHNAVNLADARPCSIGNLQKGEWCTLFTFQSYYIMALNILYDIACQWSKHIWTRMSAFPHQYHIKHHKSPSSSSHIAKCQTSFSFNFIKGVSHTDGEALNTREMGPGSRRDTLDDHFNDWNWKKICAMGLIFRRKYKFALIEVQEHVNNLTDFEASLATDELAAWRKDIEAWEEDRSQPNPFEDRAMTTMTQAAVPLALSMAEATEIERSNNVSLHDDILPSMLISSGLELEDQQWLDNMPQIFRRASSYSRANAFRRCIDTWGQVQLLYMPGVSCLHLPDDIATDAKVHNINLFLPSSLSHRVLCDDRLLEHEWELCQAQAYDTLNDLRTVLNLQYHLYKYKDTFIQGQGALLNLASRLGKNDEWERSLKPLDKQKDVQNISWIWKTSGSNSNELGLQDLLSRRWEEEVELLHEEMHRVIAFLDWHAGWWDMQGPRHAFNSLQAREGALAYAQCQANLRRTMAVLFKSVCAANPSWQAPLVVDLHS